VVSPLLPNTVNYGTGYFAGNLGFRRAQFRVERFVPVSRGSQLTLQASLNQDIVADFPAVPGIQREASDWPVLQARVAITNSSRPDGLGEATLGCSAHLGETGFDFVSTGPPPLNLPPEDDARFKTWSFNVDLQLRLTRNCGLRAEFFQGSNLSAFLGGIGQGICPCRRVPIRSTGGWVELSYQWRPKLRFHYGYGVDDPREQDTLFGRSYNQFIYSNVIFNVSERLMTGFEVTHWKTLYHEQRVGLIPADQLMPTERGEAVTFNWTVRYTF
jgi:hypothetical protein